MKSLVSAPDQPIRDLKLKILNNVILDNPRKVFFTLPHLVPLETPESPEKQTPTQLPSEL